MNETSARKSDMVLNEVYFWTSTIVQWKHLLKQDKYKEVVVGSLRNLVERKCIVVYGFVVMPNHVHFIWEMLTKNKTEMPEVSFSKFTSHEFKHDLSENHPKVLDVFKIEKMDRSYQFWQRDPLAVEMRNKEMLLQKLDYIHTNPLNEKWNLADRPENYKWSSARFYETGQDDFGFLTHFAERF